MQDLSETLELIRLSIYISFGITGAIALYFIGFLLFRLYRKMVSNKFRKERAEERLHNLEMRTFEMQLYLEKSSKGKYKPNYE